MTLRKKIFFITAYSVEGMMILLYVAVGFFFFRTFVSNEAETIGRNAEWVNRAIHKDISVMDRQLFDWSQWDDMYAFADAPTKEFVDSNLPAESLAALNVDFIVIANREGVVLASSGIDSATRKEIPVPDEIKQDLHPGSILAEFNLPSDSHSGIILLSSGPAFIATRPIVTSHGEGPFRGTVAFVKMLDDSYRQGLSDFLGYPLTFAFFNAGKFPEDFSENKKFLSSSAPVRTVVGETKISGYGFIPDIFGSPLLFYRLEKSMPGSVAALKVPVLLSLVGFFLIATLIIFFLLHWMVLSRVTFLSRELERVRKDGLSGGGVVLSGKDEIADLADELNLLLYTMSRVREQGDIAEKRFEAIANNIPAMIWMVGRKRQCLYVNKQTAEFSGNSETERFMDEWQQRIHPDDAASCLARCADAFENRKPLTMEYRVSSAKGAYRWILDSSVPYSSSPGVFLGFLHVAVDITKRKSTEESEVSKRKEAERLNAIMVSRELRMIDLKKEIRQLRNALEKSGGAK